MPDVADLAGRFSGRLLTEADAMAPFLVDWRGLWHGAARAVAQPDTPDDAASVVRWCAAHRVPVVPQGGNTGLSGGATPGADGSAVVLSLSRLNRIRAVDREGATMTVDAGCALQSVQQAADAAEMLFPLSLAAEGSCTIGGNLATNAGGTAVLRYGTTRELCLGLEVVTASGELWNGLRSLRKDNTGYDLRDLFIGSEGTLGVITGAVLKLFPQPASRVCALLAVESPAQALRVFTQARSALDAQVTSAEFFSSTCLSLVRDHFPSAAAPFRETYPWYLLLEVSTHVGEDDARQALENVLGSAAERGLVLDGAVAQTLAQSRGLWQLREWISEAQGKEGAAIKHDISLPLSAIPAFLAEADEQVTQAWPELRFVTFGHVGDGNIHYNFSPARSVPEAVFLGWQDGIMRTVHDIVARHGGSVSAEHGLGVLRRDEAARFRSPVETALLRAIKTALDPHGIMNPGKMLT